MESAESQVALEGKGLKGANDEFIRAVERGDCPEVQRLLSLGVSINARRLPTGKFNSGAVEASSKEREGFFGAIELRVSVINVNDGLYSDDWVLKESLTRTALQAASDGGHHTLVKLLIGAGAEINAAPAESHGRTALQAAAGGGYLEIVRLLIDAGAEVNDTPAGSHGRTALQAAAGGGHQEIVKLLIDAGAEVNAAPAEYDGRTTLQAAAGGGYLEIVKLLIDAGAEVNAALARSLGRTALQAAAGGGYLEIVKLLIDAGAEVNAALARSLGRTALQAAAGGGHQEIVKLLIDAGAEVNAAPAEYDGRTTLQAAAGGGHQEIVKLLIDAGAEINAAPTESHGRTALQAAARGGYLEIVKLLIDAGAEVNAAPAEYDGRTTLQAAAGGGHQEIVKLLIDAGAEINAAPAESHGRTALQAAAGGGHQEIVKLLIDAGAEINAAPAESHVRTALQAAAGGGHQEIVKLLIDAGAEINAAPAESHGRTALQAAAGGGYLEIVKLLIDAGAEVNAAPAESKGRTALQAAAAGGHQEIVKLLIDAGAGVNVSPANYGKTALQAAAGGGYLGIVMLLIDAGAEVNAAPAEPGGRTALQAAAGGGYLETVKLLIDAGAEVNMNQNGTSLLVELADLEVRMDIIGLLLHAPRQDLTLRDRFGFTSLHQALREYRRHVDDNDALLADNVQKLISKLMEGDPSKSCINIKDHSGKTPLETALEIQSLPILKQLLSRGADTDHALRTEDLRKLLPSAGGLIGLRSEREGETHIVAGNGVLEWPCSSDPDRPLGRKAIKLDPWINISLGQPDDDGTYASFVEPYESSYDRGGRLLENPNRSTENYILFKWWLGKLGEDTRFYSGVPGRASITGLGGSEKDRVKGPAKVGVIGYLCFCVFIPKSGVKAANCGLNGEGEGEGEGEGGREREILQSFKFESQGVEISWIMAHPSETPCEPRYRQHYPEELFLRSLLFLGTVRLEYLSIPSHGVEFATLFLDDIHRRWLKLLEGAKGHLADIRDKQLVEGGRNSTVIQCLLEDSQQWNRLRSSLKLHILKAQELLKMFKEHEALFMEVAESEDDSARITNFLSGKETNIGKLGAVVKLSKKITLIEKCMEEITELKTETKEMIELEFNLVSIHEARRSLEMSEISNQMAKDSNQMAKDSNEMARRSLEMSEISNQMAKDSNQMAKDSNEMARISIEMSELSNKMAKDSNEMTRKSVEMSELSIKMSKHSNSLSLSMKRLSWITFIFLPLTFVSGLFGMNLDILANNPSWTWYFVIAGSVLALVFVVWIIFKYLPISDWIEKNIGDRLESSFTTGQAESTPESAGLISPPGVSSSDEITPSRSLLSLRRRLIPVRENNRAHDTEKGTMATGASEQVTNLDSDSNLV